MKKIRGNKFTLIELLCVIAMVVLLVALLLPALKSAQEKARAITCSGNMKQVGSSTVQYTDDNNDWLYSAYNNGRWEAVYYYMPLALAPYYGKSGSVLSFSGSSHTVNSLSKSLVCPSDDKKWVADEYRNLPAALSYQLTVVNRSHSAWAPDGKDWGGGHYALNTYRQKRFRQITPGSAYCAESFLYRRDGYEWAGRPTWGLVPSHVFTEGYTNGESGGWENNAYNAASFIHNQTSSFLFTDGHVGILKRGTRFDSNWKLK